MTATELIAREQANERARQREVVFPFAQERADAPGDGFTLEGYAAVFNTPAHIEDFDGVYDEVIAPGAFKRTLNARTPVLMFNHGRHPLLGPMPIGAFEELREDPRGLYVRARLFNNYLVWPVRDAIAAGAIDGMSFRFEIEKQSWAQSASGGRVRTVKEARVPELGPVVFPAYEDAKVIVRSLYDYTEHGVWAPAYLTELRDRQDQARADEEVRTLGDPEAPCAEDFIDAEVTIVEDRAAIPPHRTATTDAPWDGPAVMAATPNEAPVLRYMAAWADSSGDPGAKATYKFPHHAPEVGSPANLAGVRNALARLPQADIPDADRPGVEAHLRAHLNAQRAVDEHGARERARAAAEEARLRDAAAAERSQDLGTSDELADLGTSDELAALDDDPANGHSESRSHTSQAERQSFVRKTVADKLGARKEP